MQEILNVFSKSVMFSFVFFIFLSLHLCVEYYLWPTSQLWDSFICSVYLLCLVGNRCSELEDASSSEVPWQRSAQAGWLGAGPEKETKEPLASLNVFFTSVDMDLNTICLECCEGQVT